jgi:hypothetical protein
VGKPKNDRSLELKHAADTTAVFIKTLDFSLLFRIFGSHKQKVYEGSVDKRQL